MNRRDAIKAAVAGVATCALPAVAPLVATANGVQVTLPKCRSVKATSIDQTTLGSVQQWLVEARFDSGTELSFIAEGPLMQNVLYQRLWNEASYGLLIP
jgi:hypothetical protein